MIFVVTRLVDAVFLFIGAHEQSALLATSPAYHVSFPTEGSPGYWGVLSNWDGQWYRSIAESGYPSSLPTEGGEVVPNEWAFYPGYPMLVRLVMMITRFDFGVAAGVVSLACAGVAVVLLYRMLVRTGDRFVALGSVLCLCTYPGAPILQVGYSEGLALLLIVISVSNLRERRYGRLAVGMVLLSLTRPVVLPFAIAIGVHWFVRWRRARVDPFPLSERVSVAGVALTAVLSAGIWPVVVAVGTGDAAAFSKTQSAWPANRGGHGLWANWMVTAASEQSVGLTLAILLMLAVIGYAVSRPAARSWGLELRTWSLAYPVYLLIATRPTPSILRYLILAAGPLWPLPEMPSARESPTQRRIRWTFSRRYRVARNGRPVLLGHSGVHHLSEPRTSAVPMIRPAAPRRLACHSSRSPFVMRCEFSATYEGETVPVRMTAVMIGVEVLARSRKFNREGLGCTIDQDYPQFVSLGLGDGSSLLALYEREAAAQDAVVSSEQGSGFRRCLVPLHRPVERSDGRGHQQGPGGPGRPGRLPLEGRVRLVAPVGRAPSRAFLF